MNTQSITRDGTTGGVLVRDIRTAPGYSARSARVECEGTSPTATSAGWGVGATRTPEISSGDVDRKRSGLLDRLHERKLVQWTLAYLGVAWLVLQLTGQLGEMWGWTAVFQQAVSLVLGFGIMPALVVAWYHGEKGRQEVCSTECALVAASIMSTVVVVWSFIATAVL